MKADTEFSGRIIEVDYERSTLLVRYEGLPPDVGANVVMAPGQEAEVLLCPCGSEPSGCHPRCSRRASEPTYRVDAAAVCEQQAERWTDDRARYVAHECASAIRATHGASLLAQRVADLHEKAAMPLDQARELALSERGISTERIDAVARQYFTTEHGESVEEWGGSSLNAQWLESIGRPFARSLLVAFEKA